MAFRLFGKDFQAHASFDLDAKGLTVLIGPGNEGKSSIFRGFKALMRNLLGAHYVRTDGEKLELTLEYEGVTVNATRTKKGSPIYTISSKDLEKPSEYKKLNKAIPDEVVALGFNEVRIGDVVLDPVFGKQGGSQFMLEEGPTALNTIFGAFSSTDRLEQGKRSANVKIAEKNSEAKTLSVQKREAEELVAKLEKLALRAAEITAEVDATEPELNRCEAVLKVLDSLILQRSRVAELHRVIEAVTLPSLKPAEMYLATYDAATDLVAAKVSLRYLHRVLGKLEIPDVAGLVTRMEIIENTGTLMATQARLVVNRKWFAEIEVTIAAWRQVVSNFNLIRAVSEVIDLRSSTQATTARRCLARLDALSEQIALVYASVDSRMKQVAELALYEKARAERTRISKEEALIGVQLLDARTLEETLKATIEAERKREMELARTVTCTHCGETFLSDQNTPGGDHEHNHTAGA